MSSILILLRMVHHIEMIIVLLYLTIPKTLGSNAWRAVETVSSFAHSASMAVCDTGCTVKIDASVWLTGTQVDVNLASITAPPNCELQGTTLGRGYVSEKVIWLLQEQVDMAFSFGNGVFSLQGIFTNTAWMTEPISSIGTNLALYRGKTVACLSIVHTAIDGYNSMGDCEVGLTDWGVGQYVTLNTPIRFLNWSFLTVSSSNTYFGSSLLEALSTPTCIASTPAVCSSNVDMYLSVKEVWQGVPLTFGAAQATAPPDCARPLESLGPGYIGSSEFFTFTHFAGSISFDTENGVSMYVTTFWPINTEPENGYLEIDTQTIGCLTSLHYLADSCVASTDYIFCDAVSQPISQIFTFSSIVTDTGPQPFVMPTNGRMMAIPAVQAQLSLLNGPVVSTSSIRSVYASTLAASATLIPLANSNSEISQVTKIILVLAACTAPALVSCFLAFFVWRRRSVQHNRNGKISSTTLYIRDSALQGDSLTNQQIANSKLSPSKKKRNWRAPLMMLGGIIFAVAFAIGHHCFNYSVQGHPVQDIRISQSWVLRIGNLLAFAVKISLSISVGTAFVQVQWVKIRQKPLRVIDIDTLSSALENILSFGASSMWIRYPVITLMAMICWLFPIVPVITPGTINVVDSPYTNLTQLQVPQLGINSSVWATSAFTDNTAISVGTPSLSKLVMGTAFLGSILPIQIDHTNITYHLDFFAPALKCGNASTAATWAATKVLYNHIYTYYSWVPGENISAYVSPCGGDINNLDTTSQDHARLLILTNDFNMIFNPDSTINMPNSTMLPNNLTECALYNASYSVDFAFEQSQQTVTIQNVSYVNGVACNLIGSYENFSDDGIEQKGEMYAYAALMAAFGSLFIGSVMEDGPLTTHNCTSVEYLAMDLFTRSGYIQSGPNTLEYLQRSIETLSHNITISLLHDAAFQKSASEAEMVPVNITTILTTYHYVSSELILTYTIAILVALLCSLIGFHAFLVNEGSYQNIFSTFLRATRNLEFTIENEDTGADPCPRDLSRALVVMTQNTKNSRKRQHLIPRKPIPISKEKPS